MIWYRFIECILLIQVKVERKAFTGKTIFELIYYYSVGKGNERYPHGLRSYLKLLLYVYHLDWELNEKLRSRSEETRSNILIERWRFVVLMANKDDYI